MKPEKHKIARIVVDGRHYDRNGSPKISKLIKVVERFIKKAHGKQEYKFVVTAGGFLNFDLPEHLQIDMVQEQAEKKLVNCFCDAAECEIHSFFNKMGKELFQKLQSICKYMTIGIDGYNYPTNNQSIELVGLFDLKKKKVIRWTGKFYPTENQKKRLIKINDWNKHFIKVGGDNVIILGCHDLNVFNARGQAKAKGERRRKANKFKRLSKEFEPDIILQHPHTTHSPNVWLQGWAGVNKEFPNLKHYASGINYQPNNKGVIRPIEKVLDKTKKGDVVDFV